MKFMASGGKGGSGGAESIICCNSVFAIISGILTVCSTCGTETSPKGSGLGSSLRLIFLGLVAVVFHLHSNIAMMPP